MIFETLICLSVAAADCCGEGNSSGRKPSVTPGPVCAIEDHWTMTGAHFEDGCPVKSTPILLPGDVWFEFGSAKLTAEGESRVVEVAARFDTDPSRRYYIDGHTDAIGSGKANFDLSNRRAVSVRDALVAAGISGDRLLTRGFGEERPVASNKTEAGRARNRRVEIVPFDRIANGVVPTPAEDR